ncbi:stimulated by retinoic acid 6 protein, partial [Clarias magur]
ITSALPSPKSINEAELNEQCGLFLDHFLVLCLLPSVFISLLLSFVERRKKVYAFEKRFLCLRGRFGIVVPLDFTSSLENRWSYAFAFGATAPLIFNLFFGIMNPFPYTPPRYLKVFVYLISSMEVGIVCKPFFACLSTPHKMLGGVLGLLYTLAWLIVKLRYLFWCKRTSTHDEEELDSFIQQYKLLFEAPNLLSLGFLLFRFGYMIVNDVLIHLKKHTKKKEEKEHQYSYVQRLLRRPAEVSVQKSWFQKKVYEWDPYFKFPNRIIATVVLSFLGVYLIVFIELIFSSWCTKMINGPLQNEIYNFVPDPIWITYLDYTTYTWYITSACAAILSVIHISHVMVYYRKHIKSLWAGEKRYLPTTFTLRPAVSVAGLLKYPGYQIAFTMWGYLMVHLGIFTAGMVFVYLVILPIQKNGFLSWLLDLITFLTNFFIVFTLMKLQRIVIKWVFLQDKNSPHDEEKPLALNNRKAFHTFNYYLFFFNVILGLGSCVLRLIRSAIVALMLVSRIERTVMPQGFKKLDASHCTWVGMIITDHHHNNPVLVCFCHLLVKHTLQSVQKRAHIRWALVYTLLRNPKVILLRKKCWNANREEFEHAFIWAMSAHGGNKNTIKFIVQLLELIWCSDSTADKGGLKNFILDYEWLLDVPQLLCLGMLMCRFGFQTVKDVLIRLKKLKREEEVKSEQLEYVKRLLRRPAERSVQKNWFQRRVYEWDPYFKFPNRIITTVVLSFFSLYLIVLLEQILTFYCVILSSELWNTYLSALLSQSEFIQHLNYAKYTWYISCGCGTFSSVIHIIHVLVYYRKHIKSVWAGEKKFLPRKYKPTPAVSLCGLLKYPGFQIAYTLWGYLIVHLAMFIAGMVFVYLVIYPITTNGFLPWLINVMTLLANFFIMLVVMALQRIFIHIFFLQDKKSPLDKEKPLALDNRKVFHNLNYFLFFFNMILGLMSCVMRVLKSAIVGLMLLPRIERAIMPQGFEKFDNMFVYLISSMEVGIVCKPFFACLSTPDKLLGGVLGLLYTLAWFIVQLWDLIWCKGASTLNKEDLFGFSLQYEWLFDVPHLLSLGFLFFRFGFMIVNDVLIRLKKHSNKKEVKKHQYRYVQTLLRQPVEVSVQKSWFQRKVYKWDPYFKFPNRIIATVVLSCIGLYLIVLTEQIISTWCIKMIHGPLLNYTYKFAYEPTLKTHLNYATYTWYITSVCAAISAVINICHVMVYYRKHIKSLRAGEKQYRPKTFTLRPAVSVAGLLKYPGYQIAFTMWA